MASTIDSPFGKDFFNDMKKAYAETQKLDKGLEEVVKSSVALRAEFSKMKGAGSGFERYGKIVKKNGVNAKNSAASYKLLQKSIMNLTDSVNLNTVAMTKNAKGNKRMETSQKNLRKSSLHLWRSFKRLLIVYMGFAALQQTIKFFIRTTTALDSLNFAMKKVITDSAEFAQTQQYLSRIVEGYGLDLIDATRSYTKFRAAVGATNMTAEEGQKIFESFAKAGAVLGLRQDELNGVFLALEQMISKGKVTTEELRRQLGERIPGAFNIMANAMDVSVTQLDKLMREGKVLSEDALPKFAAELEKTFGIEQVRRVDTLAAAQQRMKTAWIGFIKEVKASAVLKRVYTDIGYAIKGFRKLVTGSVNDVVAGYKEQKTELIKLKMKMFDVNTTAEDRVALLEEMIKLDPDIGAGIDAQAIDYGILAVNINAANKELLNKIILEELLDKEDRLREQVARRTIRYTKAQIQVEEQFGKIMRDLDEENKRRRKEMGKGNEDWIKSNKLIVNTTHEIDSMQGSLGTKITAMSNALAEIIEKEGEWTEQVNKRTGATIKNKSVIATLHNEFEVLLNNLVMKESQLISKEMILLEVEDKRIEIANRLNLELDKTIKKKKKVKEDDPDAEEKARKASEVEIRLIQKQISARLALNSLIQDSEDKTYEQKRLSNEETLKGIEELYRNIETELEKHTESKIRLGEIGRADSAEKMVEMIKNSGLEEDIQDSLLNNVRSRLQNERTLNKANIKLLKDETAEKLKIKNDEIDKYLAAIEYAANQDILKSEKAAFDKIKTGKLTATEILQIEHDLAKKMLNIRILSIEDMLDEMRLDTNERANLEMQLFRQKQQLWEEEINWSKKIRDVKIADIVEYGQKVSEVLRASNEFAAGLNDRAMFRAEEKRDFEVLMAGDSATEKEKAERNFAIKSAQIKKRQAIADKAFGAFDVIINTAIAITKYLTQPWMITLVAAVGALQLATVLAQPIPKYEKGRKDGKAELAQVSEGGFEIIRSKDGQMTITPETTSLAMLQKGDEVIPHIPAQQMLANAAMDNIIAESNQIIDMSGSNSILRQIRDKSQDSYVGNYKFTNKRGIRGRYAVRI